MSGAPPEKWWLLQGGVMCSAPPEKWRLLQEGVMSSALPVGVAPPRGRHEQCPTGEVAAPPRGRHEQCRTGEVVAPPRGHDEQCPTGEVRLLQEGVMSSAPPEESGGRRCTDCFPDPIDDRWPCTKAKCMHAWHMQV
ncbi:hypothetical protein NDU88_000501 [Pleurodeles waltl]|uniref:Uncharacterized protein n=1 Tax=Pleurodeles waltl TaxID=8319 RepID=A0AAV7SX69_PLEWA|nr:hypothetical protein NDU88_000501 [Pleurodeles waltl]